MTEPTVGATPAAASATPAQTPPAATPGVPAPSTPTTPAPSPAPDSSATDYPDGLGDAGKRALDAMKRERNDAQERSKAVEKELEKLRTASLSDSEKAIAEAKKAGGAEIQAKFEGQIRRSEVRAALTAAGINAQFLDLASKADQFAKLKVNDDGAVDGLAEAVGAFKATAPDAFKAQILPGIDLGAGGASGGTLTRDQITKMSPEDINKRWPEVMAAMGQPKPR